MFLPLCVPVRKDAKGSGLASRAYRWPLLHHASGLLEAFMVAAIMLLRWRPPHGRARSSAKGRPGALSWRGSLHGAGGGTRAARWIAPGRGPWGRPSWGAPGQGEIPAVVQGASAV